MRMIDLDVFTPSDDRAVRLVVGKAADQSTAARMDVPPAPGRSAVEQSGVGQAPIAGTQAPPVDTPHAVNDDFKRIQVLGSINE